jgi:SAM-dependent methyltransferase
VAFLDHFSEAATLYAASRPQYPQALFEFIAAAAPATARAWDCATGNGQAAAGLARHFDAVEASDASAEQIAHAVAHQRVRYSVQPAEATDFPAAHFDTITVAQALHWFDVPAFFREARRVLRPDGLLVVSGYNWFKVDAPFDATFADAIHAPMRDSWPAQNALVWNHYRDIDFPFPRIDAPEIALKVDWTFPELLAFVHSWSGTRRHIATHGREFFDDAERRLAPLWGRPGERRRVTMPLTLIACQFTPERKTP